MKMLSKNDHFTTFKKLQKISIPRNKSRKDIQTPHYKLFNFAERNLRRVK